ncbi:hypothetical protein K2Z84_27930 [Candidatus Binatia bacterium]|nr:hypothetical protein [Candidatus Binatia bacterium]
MAGRIHVTIFGAGVAGLTAAHELIERGFAVTVVEGREDPQRPGDCQVGGMARTQWARVPGDEQPAGPLDTRMMRTRKPVGLTAGLRDRRELWYSARTEHPGLAREKAEVRFELGSDRLDDDAVARPRVAAMAERLKEYLRTEVLVGNDGQPIVCPADGVVPPALVERLYVEGYRDGVRETADDLHDIGERRARNVGDLLATLLAEPCGIGRWTYADLVELAVHDVGAALDDRWTYTGRERRVVRLRMKETLLPGEHGYRFFPAFYRHVFDSMQRTPMLDVQRKSREEFSQEVAIADARRAGGAPPGGVPPVGRYRTEVARGLDRWKSVESGRTTFDNLVSVNYHSIGQADRHALPAILPRLQPTSLREALQAFTAVQDELGFELLDLARYQIRIFEYVTMGARRRQSLADRSWADFIRIETYSEQFQKVMDIWPQALIGMRAYEADAQTSGNISVQMLLDQLRAGGFRDGTLNAPTSVAWLEPWRRYLEDQGVRFVCARLGGIGFDRGPVFLDHRGHRLDVADDGYVVLALPVEEAQRVAAELRAHLQHTAPWLRDEVERSDLGKVAAFVAWDDAAARVAHPDGPLQHFSGIQYYLEQDHSLVRGHTYFANSPWGVTSISQAQFRVDRPDWRQQYRGIVSVDIGSCYEPGRALARRSGDPATRSERAPSVWSSAPDEVAREIWAQMNDAIGVEDQKLPDPLWYHIDDDLEFAPGARGVTRNRTPYLLSRPRDFARRPGRITRDGVEYDLALGRCRDGFRGIVLAGSYMQTYTRLATMESANESARHAVNAILRDCRQRGGPSVRVGQLCQTWNVEDDEFPDLAWLKDVDDRLFERKLPHLVEILDVEGTLCARGGDPIANVGRLIDVLSSAADFPRSLLRLGAPHALLRALADALSGGTRED